MKQTVTRASEMIVIILSWWIYTQKDSDSLWKKQSSILLEFLATKTTVARTALVSSDVVFPI